MIGRVPVRPAAIAAGTFTVLAAAWALMQAVAAPTHDQRVTLAGPLRAVDLRVDGGDLDIDASADAAALDARARVRAVLPPTRRAAASDGRAELAWSCRLWTSCRVGVRAVAPAGVAVTARTGFGDITVAGPAGDLDLRTSSGEVRVTGARGARVRVRTRSGGAALVLASPREVDVEVSSGDIEIRVPAGGYRIDASTRAGRITLRGVRHEPAAEHLIRLDTTAGDVTITGL